MNTVPSLAMATPWTVLNCGLPSPLVTRLAGSLSSGHVAVGTPVSLVGAGRGIEDDDAAVAVAVGDEQLVGPGVDGESRGPAQLRGVAAVFEAVRYDLPDLLQKFPVLAEFQDVAVAVTVPGQPHVVLLVNVDAVLAVGGAMIAVAAHLGAAAGAVRVRRPRRPRAVEPVVLTRRRRPAEAAQVLALGIEDHDRGSSLVPVQRGVVFGDRVGTLKHPHVAAAVRGHAADRAEQHAVRHLRKRRIHFEHRHPGTALRDRRWLELCAHQQHGCGRHRGCSTPCPLVHLTLLVPAAGTAPSPPAGAAL